MLNNTYILIALIFCCAACSSSDNDSKKQGTRHQKGEYIYRMSKERQFALSAPQAHVPEPYPWQQNSVGSHLKITKEFFRCKGNNLNPVKIVQEKEEMVRYNDCGGATKHSLPLRDNKEFIYPILIDLLNYIQAKTQQRVVITSGYRCPEHNAYVDPSKGNQHSKHMIGAEVSFYVQGYEEHPNKIVQLIKEYYVGTPKYQGKKEYVEFQLYEKGDSGVATPPCYNKELFVKLFHRKEGRNFDNHHPYPYISVQVRYDYDTSERVIYTWDKAIHNYLRY